MIKDTQKEVMGKSGKSGFAVLIFGATGDLTKRKLLPALSQLYASKTLSTSVPLICVARRNFTTNEFVKYLDIERFIDPNTGFFEEYIPHHLHYLTLDFNNVRRYDDFATSVREIETRYRTDMNRIYYLATPPLLFDPIVRLLQKTGMVNDGKSKKVIFEKPFGSNLSSAEILNRYITSVFKEEEVYRIDHYLGKELIQNIVILRFTNTLFKEIWNSAFIDHVQISIPEEMGIGSRGGYYDRAGAIRDMFQNHILQMLALTAMKEPESLQAEHIRDGKVKVFQSLKRIKKEDVVIGQYDRGAIGRRVVKSYREEDGVSPESTTETFVAAKIYLACPEWRNVPFYIRTGKRLHQSYSEINVILKDVSCKLYETMKIKPEANVITIRIQPDEGIALTFNAKQPGTSLDLQPVSMDFCHKCQFLRNTPKAYEALIKQVIHGDQTLFPRWDEVEESWRFIDPLLDLADELTYDFPNYPAGTWGPCAADSLLKKDNREWVSPRHTRR